MHRFDLEVEGNHTYLVDGVVVHNSPETTTGGRALKFYASVRMEIRRIESIKSGEEIKGMRARVKVVKNKLAPPFRDAYGDMGLGQGRDNARDFLDNNPELARELEVRVRETLGLPRRPVREAGAGKREDVAVKPEIKREVVGVKEAPVKVKA